MATHRDAIDPIDAPKEIILYYLISTKHLRNNLADDRCCQADEVQMFDTDVWADALD